MPKKDTSNVIAGMLSTVGAQTRPSASSGSRPGGHRHFRQRRRPSIRQPFKLRRNPSRAGDGQHASGPATKHHSTAASDAPRTLRLRPETAQQLRAAWLEAKRDDVLLTAQDFASNLVEDALRRPRRTANSS